MSVHAAAIISEERFGHEGGRLAMFAGDILDHIPVNHHCIGASHQGIKAIINFGLAGSRDLVMLPLDFNAQFFHH